jgi:hypothetical protein
MMSSKSVNLNILMIQFMFPIIIFSIYFIIDYIMTTNFLSQYSNTLDHLYESYNRPYLLRKVLVFTQEEISQAQILKENN